MRPSGSGRVSFLGLLSLASDAVKGWASAGVLSLAAFVLFTGAAAKAEEPSSARSESQEWPLVRWAVFFESLHPRGALLESAGTVNYEGHVRGFGLRLGAGGSFVDVNPGSYQLVAPFSASYLGLRKENVALDLGVGAALSWSPAARPGSSAFGTGFRVAGMGILGFRQLLGPHFFYRGAYTPIVGERGFTHAVSVTLGYAEARQRPPDQCHDVGRCDPVTGLCEIIPARDGTPCSDGDQCTLHDNCRSGACVSGTPVTCTAGDACSVPGVCNPATGACTNPPGPDGTACDDGNACTHTDVCRSGVCAGLEIDCIAPDECHFAGTCNPATGTCSAPENRPNGSHCRSVDACLTESRCEFGVCKGGRPLKCDDGDRCTTDACDPSRGCVHADQSQMLQIAGVQRRMVSTPNGRVELYRDVDKACVGPWMGTYVQAHEPHANDCGPTAGLNLLEWYGATSDYPTLRSEMRTDEWMDAKTTAEIAAGCAVACSIFGVPDVLCVGGCTVAARDAASAGTLPKHMKSTLEKHVPAGYRLAESRSARTLEEVEALLRSGATPVVLLSTGSNRLHWAVITGTYQMGHVSMVRFANAEPLEWASFVKRWRFDGDLNKVYRRAVKIVGLDPYVMFWYEPE